MLTWNLVLITDKPELCTTFPLEPDQYVCPRMMIVENKTRIEFVNFPGQLLLPEQLKFLTDNNIYYYFV